MSEAAQRSSPVKPRRARDASRAASRSAILAAARKVAARDGARDMSLRGVAAEAGFAPAALYGYFHNKDELLLALAADDLTVLARAVRDAGPAGLAGAGAVALNLLRGAETMAAASAALAGASGPNDAGKRDAGKRDAGKLAEAERLFNGRLIAALKALSDAAGLPTGSRQSQCDVVLVAASLAGLALLARSGRLGALGFSPEEMIARLDGRFGKG
jgi:AcrR family transcriptional regulator